MIEYSQIVARRVYKDTQVVGSIGNNTSSGAGAIDWTDILNVPSTFAPSAHSHAQSDITGLATSLSSKSDTGHTHTGVYAPSTHSHLAADLPSSYTALSITTMTGNVTGNVSGSSGSCTGQSATTAQTSFGSLTVSGGGGNMNISGGGAYQTNGTTRITYGGILTNVTYQGTAIGSSYLPNAYSALSITTLTSTDITASNNIYAQNNLAVGAINTYGYRLYVNGNQLIDGAITATSSTASTFVALAVNGIPVDSMKLWSTSHPMNYFITNAWDGTYWVISSNHGSPTKVGYATTAGSLTSMNISQFTNNSGYLSSVSWSAVSGHPTALSQFTNDLGNYGSFITSSNIGSQYVMGATYASHLQDSSGNAIDCLGSWYNYYGDGRLALLDTINGVGVHVEFATTADSANYANFATSANSATNAESSNSSYSAYTAYTATYLRDNNGNGNVGSYYNYYGDGLFGLRSNNGDGVHVDFASRSRFADFLYDQTGNGKNGLGVYYNLYNDGRIGLFDNDNNVGVHVEYATTADNAINANTANYAYSANSAYNSYSAYTAYNANTAINITDYTINQNVGTADAVCHASLDIGRTTASGYLLGVYGGTNSHIGVTNINVTSTGWGAVFCGSDNFARYFQLSAYSSAYNSDRFGFGLAGYTELLSYSANGFIFSSTSAMYFMPSGIQLGKMDDGGFWLGENCSTPHSLQDPWGNIFIDGGLNTYYGISDERAKKNIVPLSNSLDKVKQLQGVSYQWRDMGGNADRLGITEIGLIAQQVETVVPEVVRDSYRLVAGIKTAYKSVDYEHLVALLIEAVKEQQTQIDTLKLQLN